ncbi:Nif3-like dinuclear metal center hexameric protein [Cerasicoccus arenae]|uniref:GTP cyclohydrolase 1 type 2 n=1 Tax=Cerasicoccus arenae TaxID=424488 RepID=A0A8J3DDU7_9BACT|nr:Nif3-like dinuclear metal center hexameric protein [Cerasicoccus arenae]MBK1858926.1 Nif3-like dinuclear metal center hexameric protein [Cerasicoccus arenae]GHC08246.1 GTP cyclohydrolase 1 type 2 [Cerasicoccus arenae]
MARLKDIVEYCDQRTHREEIADFPGAHNGLQFENHGDVTKIGAAVDAGLVPFTLAAERGIDFLIVHHGMFWNPPTAFTGVHRKKLLTLFANNLAVYGSHLPLDCHPQIGNNAILARKLGLNVDGGFVRYEKHDIAVTAPAIEDRAHLRERLKGLFPETLICIEAGPQNTKRIGILTGSGRSAIPELRERGIDTFITGELKQEHFNIAQELEINLYLGGHYATETFGVCALAEDVADKFNLQWEFIDTGCPL